MWLEKNSIDKFAVWVLKEHDTVRHLQFIHMVEGMCVGMYGM